VSRSPETAIAGRSFQQVWIGAVIWSVAFGGTVAASAVSYVATFPTDAERQQVATATSGDAGLSVLLGPTASIDTVGGYTVYKCFVFLTTIGAIWGLLAATKLLRGEEDAGRWQLVLSGSTRAARATAATLTALLGAVGILFLGTTLLTIAAGRDPDVGFDLAECMLYGLSIVIAPATFVMVGAVTSQLCRTRRMASTWAMGVFGACFVIRMVADAGPDTHWLRWATPFGWTELVGPFTENDPWPLLPAAVTVVALGIAAVALSSRRDAGGSVFASRDVTELRPFGLASPLGFAVRLDLPILAAWCAGALVTGLSFGFIAKIATGAVPESLSSTLDQFGSGGSFVDQYFGVAFLLAATVVALIAAGQLKAAADEESTGRLAHLLAGPVRRATWFGGRLGLAAAGIVVAGLLAGIGAWLGAASQGVDLGFGSLVGAGLNVVPTALLVLGIGAVVLALAPRAAAITVYVVVIGSLLVDLLSSMVDDLAWTAKVSVFHTMALAPGTAPDPATLALTTLLGLALCAAATALFVRRDIALG
jgi:ABC-2 type transport system permease protein